MPNIEIPRSVCDSFLGDLSNSSRPLPEKRFSVEFLFRRFIYSRLKSDPGIKKSKYFGSMVRGTAVVPFSDTDIMCILPGEPPIDPTDSVSTLTASVERIVNRFLEVHVDLPALTITEPFTGLPIDFVPAHQTSNRDYQILDSSSDTWILSRPALHTDYVITTQRFSGKHSKELLRIIKLWNYCNDIGISTIYLEMLVCEHLRSVDHQFVVDGLIAIFLMLKKRRLSPLLDPSHETARYFLPASGDFQIAQHYDIILEKAIDLAYTATAYESAGRRDEVIQTLTSIFPRENKLEKRADYSHAMFEYIHQLKYDFKYTDKYVKKRRNRATHLSW